MTSRELELAAKKAEASIAATELKRKQAKQEAVSAKDRAGKAKVTFKAARKEAKLAKGALRLIEEEASKALKAFKKLRAKLAKAGKKRAAEKPDGAEARTDAGVTKRRTVAKSVEPPARSKKPRKVAKRPAQPKPVVHASPAAEQRAANGAKPEQTYVPI